MLNCHSASYQSSDSFPALRNPISMWLFFVMGLGNVVLGPLLPGFTTFLCVQRPCCLDVSKPPSGSTTTRTHNLIRFFHLIWPWCTLLDLYVSYSYKPSKSRRRHHHHRRLGSGSVAVTRIKTVASVFSSDVPGIFCPRFLLMEYLRALFPNVVDIYFHTFYYCIGSYYSQFFFISSLRSWSLILYPATAIRKRISGVSIFFHLFLR